MSVGVGLVLFAASSPAQAQAQPTSSSTPPDSEMTAAAPKRFGLGGEGMVLMPVGAYRDIAGPALGPIFRVGHRSASLNLEATFRSGFLLGLTRGQGKVSEFGTRLDARTSIVPLWAGLRYFTSEQDPTRGLYFATELGLNMSLPENRSMRPRFGVNLGFGYVTKEIPVDIRAQLSVLNMFEDIPRDSGSERTYLALGLSAGYTFQR